MKVLASVKFAVYHRQVFWLKLGVSNVSCLSCHLWSNKGNTQRLLHAKSQRKKEMGTM